MRGNSRTWNGLKLKRSSFASLSNCSHAESRAHMKEIKALQAKLKNRQLKF